MPSFSLANSPKLKNISNTPFGLFTFSQKTTQCCAEITRTSPPPPFSFTPSHHFASGAPAGLGDDFSVFTDDGKTQFCCHRNGLDVALLTDWEVSFVNSSGCLTARQAKVQPVKISTLHTVTLHKLKRKQFSSSRVFCHA